MQDLTNAIKLEFSVECGVCYVTKSDGSRTKIEGQEAYNLMRLCSCEDDSVKHIEHNAGTLDDLKGLFGNVSS